MKRNQILSLALFAALAVGVADVDGQDEERRRGPRAGIDVESIMSMRDGLELTDQQIGQLDAWRGERVTQRSEERARMDDMRSQLRAGQIERSDVMAYMEERRDALRTSQEQSRTRLEGILGADQIETYDGLVRERRAFARGRASVSRGGRDGVRGGRSGVRNSRSGVRSGRRGDRNWQGDGPGFRRGPRRGGDVGLGNGELEPN